MRKYLVHIPQLCLIFTLVSILDTMAVGTSAASEPGDGCVSVMASASSIYVNRIPPEITTPAVRKFLQTTANTNYIFHREVRPQLTWANCPLRALNENIVVNGVAGEVLAFLGAGDQGDVYLERTGSELLSVKAFHNTAKLRTWVSTMGSRATVGETPRLIEIDEEHQLVLMEYVEGIDMADLHYRGLTFGLAKDEVAKIFVKYKKWKTAPERGATLAMNVVYDFIHDRFVVIDP